MPVVGAIAGGNCVVIKVIQLTYDTLHKFICLIKHTILSLSLFSILM
jgi:hypothetical protein